ncbi:MAG TPA: hypothetical protein VEH09_12360 [Thermodesulfobacteriota bacterium]|jgi:hypothetical protein|nr:hypothetical protein [Thermodesulfobacteriota bacterium]
MDRRKFIERFLIGWALGGVFFIGGCAQEEKAQKLGNEEKLWKLAATSEKVEEPLDLAYAKGTPAFYRDASLAKEDPSFKPQVGGG